jgi:two-component system KDP operon response regulator KdpE
MTQHAGTRVLVVDDEKPIRRFLRASLGARGFFVAEAATGAEGLDRAVTVHPEVVILDLGLPDIDGVEVIRGIRARARTPIIVLSVREDPADKVEALEAGADDYLTKPFAVAELLARISAVMRRLVPADAGSEALRAGDIAMDVARHEVTLRGRRIDLTPTEYDVLRLLLVSAGRVVTHGRMLEEVWNKTEEIEGALHLLRVTISNLRGKIEPDPDRPAHLLTEPGIGYRLCADE